MSHQQSTLMNYAAAAAHLAIPVGTLRHLVSKHRIPHIRLGPRFVRFDVAKLDEWTAAHAVAVAEAQPLLNGDEAPDAFSSTSAGSTGARR
jgi:excisionase family DNA binding protein